MRAGGKRDAYGRSRTRAFRQSFLVSYAYRIGERLADAAGHAVKEAAEEQSAAARDHAAPSGPGTDLVPLLAAREQAVDDALDEMFGDRLTAARAVRATDLEGWNSGRAAADMASLHNRDQVRDGTALQLSGHAAVEEALALAPASFCYRRPPCADLHQSGLGHLHPGEEPGDVRS
jgi:hypothetical protein